MRAAWFVPGKGFTVRGDTPNPVPKEGEVLLQVEACDVCGSDKQIAHGQAEPPFGTVFPAILGHEIAATVVQIGSVGAGASRWRPGDKVVVLPFQPCGKCASCRRGESNLCLHQVLLGYHRPGGYAEQVVVPEALLFRRPETMSAASAAVLVDAFATPYHALLLGCQKSTPETVLVMGTGGTGLAALMPAQAMNIPKIGAFARRETALGAAPEAAAEADSRRTGREMRRWSHGGIDLIVDTVGTESSLTRSVQLVRPGGCSAVSGLGADDVHLPIAKATRKGISLVGVTCRSPRLVRWNGRKEIQGRSVRVSTCLPFPLS